MIGRGGGRVVAAILLALVTGGCCLPEGLVALKPREQEGVAALLDTLGDWAEADPGERPKRIHAELRACLADGRFRRGDCEGEFVLGRTCDDVVCLDVDVAYDIDLLRRDAGACMMAMAILYHEGVHLDQGLGDYLFTDFEEDAYRETHRMQRWLAAETAARAAPLPEVSYGPEEVFAALEEVRSGMGEDYLAEICPAHARRRRLEAFVADRGDDAIAWMEVPPQAYELAARADGLMEATVRLDRRGRGAALALTTTWMGQRGEVGAPSWPTPRAMLESAPRLDFALGFYLARRGAGADLADDWNRRGITPVSWRFAGQDLVLVLPAPEGEGEPALAFSVTIMMRFAAADG